MELSSRAARTGNVPNRRLTMPLELDEQSMNISTYKDEIYPINLQYSQKYGDGTDTIGPSFDISLIPDSFTIVCMCLSLTLLIPMFAGINISLNITDDHSNVYDILTSPLCITLTYCSSAFTIPLAFDLLLDCVHGTRIMKASSLIRIISILSLTTYNIAYLSSAYTDNFVLVQYTLSDLHIFIELSMIIWLLRLLDTTASWSSPRIFVLITLAYGVLAITFFANMFDSSAIYWTSTAVVFAFLLMFCGCSVQWFLRYNPHKSTALTVKGYYISVIIACVLIFGFTFGLFSAFSSNTSYFPGLIIIRTFFTFFLCVLPGRMMRLKIMEHNYDTKAKSSFVKFISHELRGPLASLEIGLTLLESQVKAGAPTSSLQSMISHLHMLCDDSSKLLDNLLLYEKLNRGKLVVCRERKGLVAFLCSSLTPLQAAIRSSGVVFHMLPMDSACVLGLNCIVDAATLGSQLEQFFHRALQGTKSTDEITLSAEVRHRAVEDSPTRGSASKIVPLSEYVHVSVTLAVPLSKEEKDSFTEGKLHFTREAAHKTGGGLRLNAWLLGRLAHMHGGRIGYESRDQMDSIFIELPVETAATPHDSECLLQFIRDLEVKSTMSSIEDALQSIDHIVTPEHGTRMLIVDDSATIRKLMAASMRGLGYTCIEAEDGSIALEIMKSALLQGPHFDIVLLDNEMPVLRGRDAVREFRSLGYKGIVIGVTGNALQEDVDDFTEQGADAVILKPMSMLTFQKTLTGIQSKRKIRSTA